MNTTRIEGLGALQGDDAVYGFGYDISWAGLTHLALSWGFLVALFFAVVRWLNDTSRDGSANGNESTKEALERIKQ